MLFILILVSILIVWEAAASTINYQAETSEERSNYFFLKTIYALIIFAVIWGNYMGRMEERKQLENYEKGCPQYEQVLEPTYKLKTK